MALPRFGPIPTVLLLTIYRAISLVSVDWPDTLPLGLLDLDIVDKIHLDPNTTAQFSIDYGQLSQAAPPAAVLCPSSPDDIAALVRFAYTSPRHFTIAARGRGHSVRGQAFAPGGVVVDMASLGRGRADRIDVSSHDAPARRYVDAGGEQLWIDVLHETLKHGLTPRSWTDYLHLTVGGTLSNAGISGQAFRHGPQISNVYELDVITGKGDMITCSHEENSDLFYGVLGGLGQFGVITRARISLEPAPQRVRWLHLVYTNFDMFTRDQEMLISKLEKGFDYVEGRLLKGKDVSSSSFISEEDSEKTKLLADEFGVIYLLEGAVYYEQATASMVYLELESLLKQLSFVPGFAFTKDVSYIGFLDRVHEEDTKQSSTEHKDVLHPWLNLFLPKSRIRDFESAVFKGILKNNNPMGLVLIYPFNKNKWDEKMSAPIPDEEEVFYTIGLLPSATREDWKYFDKQHHEIISFCHQEGIEFKQYLPQYFTEMDWMKHFGRKWDVFVQLKRRYDPKALLSPGQRIFTTSL